MTTRKIIDYAFDDNAKEMRDELYSSIHDRVLAHIDAKRQEIAQSLIAPQNEEYALDEDYDYLDSLSDDELNNLIDNYDQLDEMAQAILESYINEAPRELAMLHKKIRRFNMAVRNTRMQHDPLADRGDVKSKSKGTAKTNKTLKQLIKWNLGKNKKLDLPEDYDEDYNYLDSLSDAELNNLIDNYDQLDEMSQYTLESYLDEAPRELAMAHKKIRRFKMAVRKANYNTDPLADRSDIKSKSKGTAKTNRTLKQAIKWNLGKNKKLDLPEDYDEEYVLDEAPREIAMAHKKVNRFYKAVRDIRNQEDDPLADRGDVKSKSKGTAKTNRTLKQAIKWNLGKNKKLDLPEDYDYLDSLSDDELNNLIDNYDQLDEMSQYTLESYIDEVKKGMSVRGDKEKQATDSAQQTLDFMKSGGTIKTIPRRKKRKEISTKTYKPGMGEEYALDEVNHEPAAPNPDKVAARKKLQDIQDRRAEKDSERKVSSPTQTIRKILGKNDSAAKRDERDDMDEEYINETKKLIGTYNHGSNTSKVYKLTGLHDEGDPYHVKLFRNGKHYEPADYFTNDHDDAHGTAKHMLKTTVFHGSHD